MGGSAEIVRDGVNKLTQTFWQARKARFREKARAATNEPFANLLAQFRSGNISSREAGVRRAALIRASHKPTRRR